MKLIQMYDGHAVVSIHQTELKMLVEALDSVDPGVTAAIEHFDTLGSLFEAMMYAATLQQMSYEAEQLTLRRFRAEQGLCDWQPHLVLHDVDDAANDVTGQAVS